MSSRTPHRVTDRDQVAGLIRRAALGHLVSHGDEGYDVTPVPFVLDDPSVDGEVTLGRLRGHLAATNGHAKRLDGRDVLVIFPVSDGYVSPSWYPSKSEHGRVVPTWNYEVVNVHGRATLHRDPDWLLELVDELSGDHEQRRVADGSVTMPWSTEDAPSGFIARQLRAIVGVSIDIESFDAKRKLSGNRPDADRAGVIEGLGRSDRPNDAALRDAMLER